jgi:hypothetical protein
MSMVCKGNKILIRSHVETWFRDSEYPLSLGLVVAQRVDLFNSKGNTAKSDGSCTVSTDLDVFLRAEKWVEGHLTYGGGLKITEARLQGEIMKSEPGTFTGPSLYMAVVHIMATRGNVVAKGTRAVTFHGATVIPRR